MRHAQGFDAFCRPADLADEAMRYARVTDISAHGTGLVTEWPAERGATLLLLIMDAQGNVAVSVLAEARHVRPHGQVGWVVGCRFTRELTAAEWAALGLD